MEEKEKIETKEENVVAPLEVKETQIEKTEPAENVKAASKKKLPLGIKLLLLPFEIILVLAVLVLIWFTFSFFDRVKPVEALPPDYAVYLRTDSVWNAAEPLLDLDATLIAMTSPEFRQYRNTYLELKQSKLRKNFFVRQALKRRLDAALYGFEEDGNISAIGIIDSGFLSGAVRLVPHLIPYSKTASSMLELSSNKNGSFYQLPGSGYFVIKKNLIIFSTSREKLEEAMSYSNNALYTKEELSAFKSKLKEPLRIMADGQNLLKLLADMPAPKPVDDEKELTKEEKEALKNSEKNRAMLKNYLEMIVPYLSENEYTSLNFGITDSELNVSISVPMALDDTSEEEERLLEEHPVLHLLTKESVVPSMLPKFSDDVQYYTLISAGTLRELKDAAGKILPPEKDFSAVWSKADVASRMLFYTPLDDVLFSWTGDEIAIFGIEGKSEPVFGIKIADEKKRQEIFDKVFSSFIIQSDDSLLVDGLRLPCIQIPGFLMNVLKALDVNVPKPYYLIKDDYIFLSQSPENLVAINFDSKKSSKLSGSQNWTRVSSKQSPYSTLSLYYNLERSVPFFIKGNSSMSKILGLYNSGRFDLRIKDNVLTVQLQASAIELESSRRIPGFPIELENKSNAELIKSKAKKSKQIFWVENGISVNSLDCGTFARASFELPEVQYIVAADEVTVKANGGEIWAVTKSGMVYLLNSKLESVLGYPVLSGIAMTCEPFVYKDSVVLIGSEGLMCFVSHTGQVNTIETGVESDIKSRPAVSGDIIAFYEKGFFGGIHIYKNLEPVTSEGPFELDGIAYGAPCIFTAGGKQYVAMITQAGQLYVYDFDGELLSDFPVNLEGVFYLNVEMADGYLFALSADGELYRVALDGEVLKVKIPYFNARTGRITICDYDGKTGQEIFVSGEGNSLYGFNSQLELLHDFPVSGYGNPVFQDLNGDNKNDCLAITFDNKISASSVLK